MITKIVIGTLVSAFLAFMIYGWIYDNRAIKKGKRKLTKLGYEFLEQRIHNAHYGLYFRAQGHHLYAKYTLKKDGSFDWIDGSPEEKLEVKLQKITRKLTISNQASHTMAANARLFRNDHMNTNLNRFGTSTEAAIVWI